MTSLPENMRALELTAYDGKTDSLHLTVRPVPKLQRDQVLVRIAAAPLNPSDLMFLQGRYGSRGALPRIPGFEASGVVVASGGGLGRALIGRRVACGAANGRDGTWAEFTATNWNRCVPLLGNVSLEQGAVLLVNPLSAFSIIQMARHRKQRALALTAAASQLGRMINNLARRYGMDVVNIVRRQEQVDLLKSQGATYVLKSGDSDFANALEDLCRDLRVRVAFDAVGGELTGTVLNAMPTGSCLFLFGDLEQQACRINPRNFIFEDKRIDGFWLANWFPAHNLIYQFTTAFRAQRLLDRELKTEIRERIPLEQAARAMKQYTSRMTEGKILLLPNTNG